MSMRVNENDAIRKNLAIAQSYMGLHEQAYSTITPYLGRNGSDIDALMVGLYALYQMHVEGKSLGSAEDDKAHAAQYARAYIAAKGPMQALFRTRIGPYGPAWNRTPRPYFMNYIIANCARMALSRFCAQLL